MCKSPVVSDWTHAGKPYRGLPRAHGASTTACNALSSARESSPYLRVMRSKRAGANAWRRIVGWYAASDGLHADVPARASTSFSFRATIVLLRVEGMR
jgi:hypothetical protein